jgi:hypothetical protein
MIIDLRTYVVRHALLDGFLKLWEEYALPVQLKHLQRFRGMYTVDVGLVNSVVHMWEYDSLSEREIRRAAMEASPEWREYRSRLSKLDALLRMHSTILRPADLMRRIAGNTS